ncbi:MAG: hypothetical protein PHV60_01145 [bacterium]|nr:hypothetical protein [bacterium]
MKKIFIFGMIVCAIFLLSGYLAAETETEGNGDGEHFEIKKDAIKITSTVSGNIDLDKEKLPPFQVESVPQKKFKYDAVITEVADPKFDKTMISNNDLVRINAGSKKNIAEGDMVKIFKKGKLVTERINIDKIAPSISQDEKQERKDVPVVTTIGDARVVKVEAKSSVIQILRCIESITIGDYIKLNK